MNQADKEALKKAKSEHLAVFNEEDFESGFKAALDYARSGEAVAWVEVKNTHEGPYEFHGIQLLSEGKHHLFTHSQPVLDQVKTQRTPFGFVSPTENFYKTRYQGFLNYEQVLTPVFTESDQSATYPAVAEPDRKAIDAQVSETMRLANIIADKIEDGTLFNAGIFSRKELAAVVRKTIKLAQQPAASDFLASPIPAATLGKAEPDYLGLALDLESASKKVESQTAQRAMEAGAHGLRLALAQQPAASDVRDETLKEAARYIDWYATGGNPGTTLPRWAKDCVGGLLAIRSVETVRNDNELDDLKHDLEGYISANTARRVTWCSIGQRWEEME